MAASYHRHVALRLLFQCYPTFDVCCTLVSWGTWEESAIGNPASRDIIAVPLTEKTAMYRRDFSFVGIFGRRDVMTSVIFHKYLFFKLVELNPLYEGVFKPDLPAGLLPQIDVV